MAALVALNVHKALMRITEPRMWCCVYCDGDGMWDVGCDGMWDVMGCDGM
jgi:hypothetical protein